MALGKKTGGRDWVKGQSGNPAGPIRKPEISKLKSKLTAVQFIEISTELWELPHMALVDIVQNPGEQTGKKLVASILLHAIKTGDAHRMSALLDRIIGKPKEFLNLSGNLSHFGEGFDIEEIRSRKLALQKRIEEIEHGSRKSDPSGDGIPTLSITENGISDSGAQ